MILTAENNINSKQTCACPPFFTTNLSLTGLGLNLGPANNCLSLSKFFYSPTDAQVNCLRNNFKIYIKIDTKTAPTCFGEVLAKARVMRSLMMV
jgi:hypothetical protein